MEAALHDGAAVFCKVTFVFGILPHGLAVATLSGSCGGGDAWGCSTFGCREARPVHPLGGGKTMMGLDCAWPLEGAHICAGRVRLVHNDLVCA